MIKIFISHSSLDTEIARALADLFRTAMSLSKADIRCTSVDGYRLPAGANVDEQLRREVIDAPAFVGLISHESFESAYVLFELGARWGRNAFMAPVLAPGVSASTLKGPLAGFNALSCDSGSQIHQLVHDVAGVLGIPLEPAAAFQELVENLQKAKPTNSATNSEATAPPAGVSRSRSPVSSTGGNDAYSDAEQIISRHCESQWQDDFAMRAFCVEQQRSAVEKLSGARPEGIPSEVFQRIRKKAASDWPDDFEMRLYTESQQIDSYRKLQTT